MTECKQCRGSGHIGHHVPFAAGGGWVHILEECPDCKGKGFVTDKTVGRKLKKGKRNGKEME